jgi:hypothetical protein
MKLCHTVLDQRTLKPASSHPHTISWFPIASIGSYEIEFVKWTPGAIYPDHTHLDAEYIILLSGELSDGDTTYGPRTVLDYPVGSVHKGLRTNKGAEFVLIWTGTDRCDFVTPQGAPNTFQAIPIDEKTLKTSRNYPDMICWFLIGRIDGSREWNIIITPILIRSIYSSSQVILRTGIPPFGLQRC